jgi:ribosomal protein L37AE/L43A
MKRRDLLLRFCTHCNKTTEQARLPGDDVWRCRQCDRELYPVKREDATNGSYGCTKTQRL